MAQSATNCIIAPRILGTSPLRPLRNQVARVRVVLCVSHILAAYAAILAIVTVIGKIRFRI